MSNAAMALTAIPIGVYMGVRSLRERGGGGGRNFTLRHAKLWITRFGRFNKRGGGGGGGGGGGVLSAFGRFNERGCCVRVK